MSFFLNFVAHISIFVATDTLFRTSGDVSSGFQSQWAALFALGRAYVIYQNQVASLFILLSFYCTTHRNDVAENLTLIKDLILEVSIPFLACP